MKLLNLTIPFEPLERKALYDEIALEYKFLASKSKNKMRLMVKTSAYDYELPTNFAERLADILPSLNYQKCTNHKKSFADHIREEQNDLPHVLEHVIIGLFMMVKNDDYQGVTLGTPDVAEIIVTYHNKQTARRVAYLAIEVICALIHNEPIDVVKRIKEITGGAVLIWRKPVAKIT